MKTTELQLRRNRKITAEIFDNDTIGLEVTKDKVKPSYKNGETPYCETYFNLTYGEIDAMVEFLMNIMSIVSEGSLTIDINEKDVVNA